ncbi:hypothetical protein HAX54_045087, partial [Datura stramonium]|nr:hypothetical protein [Datura stramonium]
ALMDSEKHEIMFRDKNESITFKAGRGHLFPIGVGDIYVANVVRNEDEGDDHIFEASPKKKKAKSKWVKQYLCGLKIRKWVKLNEWRKLIKIEKEKIGTQEMEGNTDRLFKGWTALLTVNLKASL